METQPTAPTAAVPFFEGGDHAPIEGHLTLDEIRNADDATRARAIADDDRVMMPMYLEGEYMIDTSVLDCGTDYYLPRFEVELTARMLPWDIMRIVAQRWGDNLVMKNLWFALLHPADAEGGTLSVALYCDPGVDLTDEEIDALPWDDDED